MQFSHTLNVFLPHLVGKPFNEENLNAMFRLPKEYGADEVMVVTITYDHAARVRSYELLADVFGLAGD